MSTPTTTPARSTLVPEMLETRRLLSAVIIHDGAVLNAGDVVDFGSVIEGGTPADELFLFRATGSVTNVVADFPDGWNYGASDLDSSASYSLLDPPSPFDIRLNSDLGGVKDGTVTFNMTNAAGVPQTPVTFILQGEVLAPEIEVSVFGGNITDGQTNPINVGTKIPGMAGPTITFTVTNVGQADLMTSEVSLPEGFELVEGLSADLAPGASDTFTVQLVAPDAGVYTGDIAFGTNDADEDPFNFAISGSAFGELASENGAVTYQDGAGVDVTMRLIGPGTISALVAPTLDVQVLTIRDSETSSLLLVNTAGNAETTMPPVAIQGSLGTVIARSANIGQAFAATESLGMMLLGDVAPGATVSSATAGRSSVILANELDGANFDLGGDVSILLATSYDSGSFEANAVGTVLVREGALGADLQANVGNVQTVIASEGISGNVLAAQDVGLLLSSAGDITGTIRGQNIGTVLASNLNNALLSAAERIGTVQVSNDVIDSHVLAGYDIGLDGLPGAGDELNGGDIGSFSFGGEFSNTHVAVGVVPIHSSLIPLPANGENSSGTPGDASARGSQGNIGTVNGGRLFGFYYDANAGSTFNTSLADDGDFVIITAV